MISRRLLVANVVDLFSARTGTAFPNTESGSRSKGFLKFLGWPFSIVFAMRPQREREAAQIAEDFGSDRWCDALDRKVSERTYSNRGL
jgi:hypothetical protein